MNIREVIERKAEDIVAGYLAEHQSTNSTDNALSVAQSLATACALLTSTSKDEREQGKTMVRRWKNGNSF